MNNLGESYPPDLLPKAASIQTNDSVIDLVDGHCPMCASSTVCQGVLHS